MRILQFLVASWPLLFSGPVTFAQPSGQPEGAQQAASETCASLSKLDVPNAHITTAQAYKAGSFAGPPQAFTGADLSPFYKKLPAFCRVVAQATPTSDSNITIEVWMPLAGWNGRLEGLGNGGFAGLIDHFELGAGISKGYATTATDAGHTGSPIDAAWALGHPEKIVDFGHRGIHEMTRVARLVVQKFYGSAPGHSYFIGCSDGGREALMEAQRYPADYDGILAGAPANYWTALLTTAVADTQALAATPASFIPPAKISAIAHAVLAACDEFDGVRDGILNDPRQCRFDPASIQCKADDNTDECLTAAQVTALKAIYAGLHDSGGHVIFPGYLPGAEEGGGGWGTWITGPAPWRSVMWMFGTGYFSDMVYGKADWEKSFSVDGSLQFATEKTAGALNAIDPDLSAFRSRGGKLILYHGWNDPAISAVNTVNYYEEVVGKLGQTNVDSFTRLYMVPGMQHCAGGPGPDMFGQVGGATSADPRHNVRIALETWVEKGTAPGAIIASKTAGGSPGAPGGVVMTRPLCPYPQAAKYKGSGDTNRDDNFVCSAEKK